MSMIIHKACSACYEIGHKSDMIKHTVSSNIWGDEYYWYHEECYVKLYNVKRMRGPEGWAWVYKEKQEKGEI